MSNKALKVYSLGTVRASAAGWEIHFQPEYREALTGLEGFSHLQVLFWFHRHDTAELRRTISCDRPYRKAPEKLGIFATRSDYRPNPVGLSVCAVKRIDPPKGTLELYYLDAENGTPVIDIKPYHPGLERVREAQVPVWCRHWPQWYEDMGEFDWAAEFNFPQD